MIAEQEVPPPVERPAWGWADVGYTIIFAALVTIGLIFIIGLLTANNPSEDSSLISPLVYVAGMGVYVAIGLGVYLFAARKAGWAALGLRSVPNRELLLVPVFFVGGICALIGVNGAIAAALGSFDNPQQEALTGGAIPNPIELIGLFVLVAGVAPFVEELFFRGMLYPLLRARFAAAIAIALNALIFAALHFIPLLIPGLFVVGLFMAYLRERSNSIWPSVLFHTLQNSLALSAIIATLGAAGG